MKYFVIFLEVHSTLSLVLGADFSDSSVESDASVFSGTSSCCGVSSAGSGVAGVNKVKERKKVNQSLMSENEWREKQAVKTRMHKKKTQSLTCTHLWLQQSVFCLSVEFHSGQASFLQSVWHRQQLGC